MTEDEIKNKDEYLIAESMISDDGFEYFDMYKISDFDELAEIGLGADSDNAKKILKALKTKESVFIQECYFLPIK